MSPSIDADRQHLFPHQSRVTCFALVVFVAIFAARFNRRPIPTVERALENSRFLQTGVDPNTATVAELTTLPGIGPKKAEAIVAFRESRRATSAMSRVFHCPEDLDEIRGIGAKTVEKLRPFLRFDR